jgi:N-acetylglutamate synthase-like GNAT family acetyltransferase
MEIRQYQSSDNSQVWELHELALKATDAFYTTGNWDDDLKNIEGVYINNRGEFLVGVKDNKIIAMGALKKISDTVVELKRMRVHPELQRHGYGQQIYEALEKRAKELGYKTIQLDTSVKQVSAQHFYLKNDYKEIKRVTEEYPLETIFYQKTINEK